jgi:hypothetical protein
VALAIAWGLVVPILGLSQDGLLPGPAHWVIQVLHLLVGLAAIGLAEALSVRLVAPARSVQSRQLASATHDRPA